ncbi:MAG TPA: hypothetical protein PKJ25_09895 [Smithellaceae bacterium]|jgi:hypothetical protein|nr:hypothetical protein [Smithellaceae bacterium]HQM43985.1 hypothetical protein [Smithellaceae bacterium]
MNNFVTRYYTGAALTALRSTPFFYHGFYQYFTITNLHLIKSYSYMVERGFNSRRLHQKINIIYRLACFSSVQIWCKGNDLCTLFVWRKKYPGF